MSDIIVLIIHQVCYDGVIDGVWFFWFGFDGFRLLIKFIRYLGCIYLYVVKMIVITLKVLIASFKMGSSLDLPVKGIMEGSKWERNF